MDQRLTHAHLKVCAYIFAGAFLLRMLYLSQYAGSPFFWVPALDSLYHDLLAQAIARGRGEPEAFFRAPLYYYFLGGVYWLFGHSFWAARLIQAALGSASCVLLYLIGQRMFRPVVGLLAAASMALYGPLVFFDGELLTPVLELFLDLACVWLVLRASDSGSGRLWLAAGLLLGLSAITRPNVLVGLPIVLGWLWVQRKSSRALGDHPSARPALPALAAAIIFSLGTITAPALVTLRNHHVSGDVVFIASQGGINLFLGNRPEANGFTPSTPRRYHFAGPYEDSVALFGQRAAEEAMGRRLSASEAQAYWVRQVVQWWRKDPVAAMKLTGKKWVLAWGRREIRNNHAFDFVRAEFAPLLWFCPFGFWFAGPFGLLGMALAWRSHPQSRWLTLFVLAYVISFVLFFVADRYRLPVVPMLLLFAAHAVHCLKEQIRRPVVARLAPAVTALIALTLFVNVEWYRTETRATWALDHWSAGNRFREMGRLADAERQYRKALSLDGENAEFWTNLGAIQYYSGRLGDAAGSFQRSLELQPSSGSGHYNLAMCELQMGRKESARQHFELAVRLEPEHLKAREELSRLVKGG
jgi:4-amino-4-deoxy-L-arabinose transferase-like glycosyltransferase